MIKNIIFDLSEVIINGLLGVEKSLCLKLNLPEKEIMTCLCKSGFEELLLGNLEEELYLKDVVSSNGWDITIDELKKAIRDNFHTEIEGVIPVIQNLKKNYKLYLLSDHSLEWVEYIKTVHPFLKVFEKVLFSYELKMTKRNPAVFPELLRRLNLNAGECLFIDDHQRNVDNARLAGIDGIRFLNVNQLKDEFDKRGVVC